TPTNYRNPIPRGTLLNEVYIDTQKTAYLDFSHHLTDGQIGGTTAEIMSVNAILLTVFDALPEAVKHVQILIDGKEVETLAGHLNISQPLRY
ncbi:GerMN domain-containing protein, partial [Candidatus Poribacteria bacterium]|nr:GerMN domain-containing protein [Candidatus Poribacteria bacterium]